MGADPVRAIVELATNSDDAYTTVVGPRKGRIRIEIERHRGDATLIVVKDRAIGMTQAEMVERLGKDGVRSSGFERGMDVRGLLGRGAKDCVAFGPVEWISTREGKESRFSLEPSGIWAAESIGAAALTNHGTTVSMRVEPRFSVPQHARLKGLLERHYALRPCLLDQRGREIRLVDVTQGRDEHLVYEPPVGVLLEHAVLPVPGFEGETIAVEVSQAEESLDDASDAEYWRHGLLVTSGRGAYEVFGGRFQREPWSQYLGWLFGHANIPGIARLIKDYDDRLDRGEPPSPSNPIRLVSRNRRGLVNRAEHPFVDACYTALEDFLQPHIEELRRQRESHDGTRELDNDTKKRLRDLGRVIGEFIDEQDDQTSPREENAALPPVGLSVIPSIAVVLPNKAANFTVRFRPAPEAGTALAPPIASVRIVEGPGEIRGGSDIVLIDRGAYFSRSFTVSPIAEGTVSGLLIEAFGATVDALVECRPVLPRPTIDAVAFEHSSYRLKEGRPRRLRVLVPWHLATALSDRLDATKTGDPSIVVDGQSSVIDYDEELMCGVASINVRGRRVGARATIAARLGASSATATVTISAASVAAASVELCPEDFHQRAMWDGNVLRVSTLDKSIKRYLGLQSKGWPGQRTRHFRALLAEVVAFHTVRRIVGRSTTLAGGGPEEIYRKHLQLERTCLQRVHSVLLSASELADEV